MLKKDLGLLILILVVSATVAFINPRFLLPINLSNTMNLIGLYGIFSIGVGLVIITGGIELSVGSMFALLGVIFVDLLSTYEDNWALASLLIVIAGLFLGSASEFFNRSHRAGASLAVVLRRAAGLPRSACGTALAHAGLGVTVIGIAATAWGVERLATMKAGESLDLGPYQVTLEAVVPRNGPDYRETAALLAIRDGDRLVGRVEPGKRTFTGRSMPTSEAGLLTVGLGQVYASVAEIEAGGSVGVRLYWKPWVLFIWLGAVVMAAGGVLSLSDRRARVGAPVRRAAPAAVPAE